MLIQNWMQQNDTVIGRFMDVIRKYADYDQLKAEDERLWN